MSKNNFSIHLQEAISINQLHCVEYCNQFTEAGYFDQIKPIKSLFNQLVLMEKVTLFPARFYDWKCPQGMKLAFVDMVDLPLTLIDKNQVFNHSLLKNDIKVLKKYMKLKQFDLAIIHSKGIIEKLNNPYTNCMLRHILESYIRALGILLAQVLPQSEYKYFYFYTISHLYLFKSSNDFDLKAFEFQNLGCPVLSRELPHIPEFQLP